MIFENLFNWLSGNTKQLSYLDVNKIVMPHIVKGKIVNREELVEKLEYSFGRAKIALQYLTDGVEAGNSESILALCALSQLSSHPKDSSSSITLLVTGVLGRIFVNFLYESDVKEHLDFQETNPNKFIKKVLDVARNGICQSSFYKNCDREFIDNALKNKFFAVKHLGNSKEEDNYHVALMIYFAVSHAFYSTNKKEAWLEISDLLKTLALKSDNTLLKIFASEVLTILGNKSDGHLLMESAARQGNIEALESLRNMENQPRSIELTSDGTNQLRFGTGYVKKIPNSDNIQTSGDIESLSDEL